MYEYFFSSFQESFIKKGKKGKRSIQLFLNLFSKKTSPPPSERKEIHTRDKEIRYKKCYTARSRHDDKRGGCRVRLAYPAQASRKSNDCTVEEVRRRTRGAEILKSAG